MPSGGRPVTFPLIVCLSSQSEARGTNISLVKSTHCSGLDKLTFAVDYISCYRLFVRIPIISRFLTKRSKLFIEYPIYTFSVKIDVVMHSSICINRALCILSLPNNLTIESIVSKNFIQNTLCVMGNVVIQMHINTSI